MSTTHMTGNQSGEPAAREKAQEVADTAADQGRHVAGTARDEAAQVAGEAREQVRALLSEATSQVDEQSRTQQQRLAGTMRSLGDDLSEMAADRKGLASDLALQVSERARSLASQLEDREPRELLDSVRDFARRRPGTFLIGALAAGVLAGRLTRATQAAAKQDDAQRDETKQRDEVTHVTPTAEAGWTDNSAAGTTASAEPPPTPSDPDTYPVISPESAPNVNPGSRL